MADKGRKLFSEIGDEHSCHRLKKDFTIFIFGLGKANNHFGGLRTVWLMTLLETVL